MKSKFSVNINADSYARIGSMAKTLDNTVKTAIADSLSQIQSQWVNLANERLTSGKEAYVASLTSPDAIEISPDGYSGKIVITDSFPKKLEAGSAPFDLKSGFANSDKVKTSKSGDWYLDVPIRHGTPNSTNLSSVLPSGIYNRMKKLPAWGTLDTSSLNANYYSPEVLKNLNGLKKIPIEGGKRNLNAYMTWRRVSANSNSDSWIHPGFEGIELSREIQPIAREIFERTVKEYINDVFSVT